MPAVYHIGMPIGIAMQLMDAGETMYQPDVERHYSRAVKLHSKGAKYYSVCPKITKDGLCGCSEPEHMRAVLT